MFKPFSDKVKSRIDNSTAIASIPQVSSNKLISIRAGIGYSGEKFASIALGISGQNKSKDFIYKLNAALSTNLNWNIGVGFNYSFIPIHDKKEGNNIEIEGLLKENNELKEKLKDNDKKLKN